MSEDQAIDAELLRRLYTAPPAEFVATRKALVAERRQAKDRAGARAIAGLRKAGGVDVALNLVAAQEPDLITAFLTAAADVREAQTAAAEGRSAASTRDALRELRAQTATLVAAAGRAATAAGVTGVTAAAATARLGELVANESAAEQLRAGHLGSGAVEAPDPFGAVDDDSDPAPARARRATKTVSPPAPSAPAPASPRQDPEAAARRERREAALARAIDQRDRAQAELDDADQQVVAAEAEVAELEAQLSARRADRERAVRSRAKVATAFERASAAVADAEAARDDG